MAREPKYGVTFNGWERLAVRLEANAAELAHLEAPRQKLLAMLAQVRELSTQQAALAAGKQETTRRLQALIADGRKLATFLRTGVREHYGNRAEKLIEFDLQPFRGRPRVTAEPTKAPEPPAPAPAGNVP
jgi:hypothetical protein